MSIESGWSLHQHQAQTLHCECCHAFEHGGSQNVLHCGQHSGLASGASPAPDRAEEDPNGDELSRL